MGRLNLFTSKRAKFVPAGSVVLQDDGTAQILASPEITKFLETQIRGAQNRVLTPKDGRAFMAAVLATCRGQGLYASESA